MINIEIVKEKETPLLSRKRVTAWVLKEGPTPSRPTIRKELAKKLKVKPELVSIRHIYSRFGKQESKVIAHIYSDEATLLRLEGKGLVEKHKSKGGQEAPAEKPKPAPAPESVKESAPKEEVKEETKKEAEPKKEATPKEEAKQEAKPKEEVKEKPKKETKPKKEEAAPKKEATQKEEPKKEVEAKKE